MSCNGCRVLRKGCSDKCVLRHCLRCIDSAEAQANATLFVTKFFGRAGLTGFINGVAESQRPALFQSLLYEACGRTVNPVYGAVGLLFSGNWAVCQGAVETVLRGGSLKPVDTGAALSSSATVPSSSLSNVDYVCPSTSMIETHHMISKPQNSGSRGAQPQVTTSTVDQYLDTCELRVKAIPSATYLDSKSCPAELKFLPDVTSYGDCSRSDQATIRSRSDGQTALLNAENHAVRKKARSSFPLHASTKNLGHTDLDFTNAVEMRDLINSSIRSSSNTDQNHCAAEMRDLINSSIRSSSNTDQNHCALDDSQTSAGDLRQAPDVDYDGMHKRHRSDNSEQEAQCPQAHLELVAPARRRMHISWHVDQRTAEKGDKNGRSCGASLPTHSSYYSYNSPFNEAQFINRGDGVVSMISSDRIQNESGESMIRLNLALRTSLSSTSNQAEHSRVCLQERRDFIPDRQPQELHRGSSPSINSEGSVNTTLAANDVAVKLQTSISHGPSKEGVKLLNLLL